MAATLRRDNGDYREAALPCAMPVEMTPHKLHRPKASFVGLLF